MRVLLYDLETSPNIGYTWGTWDQSVIKIIQHRQIISFAWKWLDEPKAHVLGMCDMPGYRPGSQNNRKLVEALHKLFLVADVTVGHNVEQFDDKRSYTDFIRHGLKPVPPHRRVDTLKFARSKFDFNSHKLDDLGERLGLGRKFKHPGFEMWEGCMKGDPKYWSLMKKYNLQDVYLLEKIYLKLRPWMQLHPNMNASDGNLGCPKCRSKNLMANGTRVTQLGKTQRWQCRDCGSYMCATRNKSGQIKRFV